ncbi:hypothetical protein NPIL_491671 [Nephila pilipes]|uniref:Uncharacterized protein n=1 Tax=Nephila pilipes TaxID=299642 RepID=A0A8X6PW24_NEPPI|nr:hypothetical protein NPIL_491671 [Nephila pilipes]
MKNLTTFIAPALSIFPCFQINVSKKHIELNQPKDFSFMTPTQLQYSPIIQKTTSEPHSLGRRFKFRYHYILRALTLQSSTPYPLYLACLTDSGLEEPN